MHLNGMSPKSAEMGLGSTERVLKHKTAFFVVFLTVTYNKKYVVQFMYICVYQTFHSTLACMGYAF